MFEPLAVEPFLLFPEFVDFHHSIVACDTFEGKLNE